MWIMEGVGNKGAKIFLFFVKTRIFTRFIRGVSLLS